jgi:transcriptional/translational regulatory protein YebC/TACO1
VPSPSCPERPGQDLEIAADAGADDVIPGRRDRVFAPAESFHAVVQALEKAGVKIVESELRMEPNQRIELAPEEAAQVMKLIEQLEELDDVQNVYSNLEITDAALAALETA